MLYVLLREPGDYGELLTDPSRLPNFIEESLRLESPTQELFRSVAQDVELHGVTIPRGSVVHITQLQTVTSGCSSTRTTSISNARTSDDTWRSSSGSTRAPFA